MVLFLYTKRQVKSMPNWTKEQSDAINKDGTNIIVSAGAGSGKTAVLSERVLRKLKEGVNVNELLILTFTKAAAKEMKERIRKKIKKEPSLSAQLELIDSAYITILYQYLKNIITYLIYQRILVLLIQHLFKLKKRKYQIIYLKNYMKKKMKNLKNLLVLFAQKMTKK